MQFLKKGSVTLLLITSLLLQSCSMNMGNMGSWGRSPASTEDYSELISKMKNFKARLMGAEEDGKCSKEELDEEFKRLMSAVKLDSCSEDKYSIDREAIKAKKCPKVRTEGYFDKVVKTTMLEEKSKKKQLTYFQNKIDAQFLGFTKEAQEFLRTITPHLNNEGIDRSSRIELLVEYVENVLLPVRDVVIVMQAYLPKEVGGKIFYEGLQPDLKTEFVENLEEKEFAWLTQGPNPGVSPFYMEFQKTSNGTVRLGFSKASIIRRDVLTLLKAPTAKNYVMALKWMTLHLMLSRVFLYDMLLEKSDKVNVPQSCQTHFNDSLPAHFQFKVAEGLSDEFLEKILLSHGLTFAGDDESYLDYYLYNVDKNPLQEGYSALVPFENYKNALQSLDNSVPEVLRPEFDDVTHFDEILSSKVSEALGTFSLKVKNVPVAYNANEIFQNILKKFQSNDIAEIQTKTGVKQIYPGKQNISPYVLDVMKKYGITDSGELITERMKKKFAGKKVTIPFPSFYSSPAWRQWSLRVLADKFYNNKDVPVNTPIYKSIQQSCALSRKTPLLNKICFQGNVLQNLSEHLSVFRSGETYVPLRRLEGEKFKEIYPLLGFVWIILRDKFELLPEAKPFELNFLQEQLAAGNQWARLKFSYMVALDQLEHQEDNLIPSYDSQNSFSKANKDLMCKIDNGAIQYNAFIQAGKVLGLDKPLGYNHAGSFLSAAEKKVVWNKIIDESENKHAHLFNVQKHGQTYYKEMENLSYKTILTEAAALQNGGNLNEKVALEIKKIGNSVQGQVADFFLKMYEVKDVKKQQALFEEFSKVNGIDTTFKLKLGFLALDDLYKKPIYKYLLKEAASTRKNQVLNELDKFCKMDINDEAQFKNIFYSTTKAQNDLNQLAGLPAVPSNVMDKIGAMTADEWRDLWWGLGSAAAGMGALIIGGACTTLSGGICAPLGGVMAMAGLSSLGIQVKMMSNELERKKISDISAKNIKVLESLGFANTGSAEEVERSYAWTAFEAISIFPMIGIATRSASLGPKIAYASTKSILSRSGKGAFKSAAKSAVQEEEVRTAHYLLGFSSVRENAGLDVKTLTKATEEIEKIKKLYTTGAISSEKMLNKMGEVIAPIKRLKLAAQSTIQGEVGKVTVRETPTQINQRAAKIVAEYFSDNPKEMLTFFKKYSGERLDKAVRVMDELKAVDRVDNQIPVFGNVKDWYLRMRNESLARNVGKILKIEKDLISMGNKPGVLESYINKNIEEFTDILIEIPFKKREIPYFVFAQGAPEFNFYKGAKIPLMSTFSEGQTLKRIMNARARLIHESYKLEARKALNLKHYVQSEQTYEVFQAFKMSVAELANRKSGKEVGEIMGKYRQLEESMMRKLHGKYKSTGERMPFKDFKRLVMSPSTSKEKAQSEAIWSSIPADELMGMKELGEFAHKAAAELSKYQSIDSFERYLGALRVLTINRNAAVLDIM